jgi:hypothetical protein
MWIGQSGAGQIFAALDGSLLRGGRKSARDKRGQQDEQPSPQRERSPGGCGFHRAHYRS